jgi:acyl carrier protein
MELLEFTAKLSNFLTERSEIPLVQAITPDTDLTLAGLIDSLMLIELLMFLEGITGQPVETDGLTMDNMRSAKAMHAFVVDDATDA